MNKTPRFVKEYAAYIKRKAEQNELMNAGIKAEIVKRVGEYLDLYARDFISTNELMRILSGDCMREGEDMSAYMI